MQRFQLPGGCCGDPAPNVSDYCCLLAGYTRKSNNETVCIVIRQHNRDFFERFDGKLAACKILAS